MYAKREIHPYLHEVSKLELRYRFLFFLRDLNIRSATLQSEIAWKHYMDVISELTVGG